MSDAYPTENPQKRPEYLPKKLPKIVPVAEGVNRPLWSVMIPTYNGAKNYLIEALQSVLDQDAGPEEMQIQVVDDGSTEIEVKAIVAEVGKGRIEFFQQPQNVGMVANWNTCIERATGQWVQILHQDDKVLPGFYSSLRAPCQQNLEIGAAYSRHVCVNEWGKPLWMSPLERETAGIVRNFVELEAAENRIQFASILVRRKVYEEIGGFDWQYPYCSDWDMWKRIAARYPIWYEPQCLAWYRWHSASTTSKIMKSGANLADQQRSIQKSREEFPNKVSAKSSSMALETYANYALNTAREKLMKGDITTAIGQTQEILKMLQTLEGNNEMADSYYMRHLYQSMAELEKSQVQLNQTQQELEKVQGELQETQAQLCQKQAEVKQYQEQYHTAQEELQKCRVQLYQQTQELEQTQEELRQKNAELEECWSLLHETKEVLEQSQSQLHETEKVLQQSQSQLHENREKAEQFQSQLHQTQADLEKSQSQLRQKNAELEECRSLLHQTEEVLEQSQSQLHETEKVLEESVEQLKQSQNNAQKYQLQLHQTQEELEQSQVQLQQKHKELEESHNQLEKNQKETQNFKLYIHQNQEEVLELELKLKQVQEERDWLEAQSQAWMQTALKTQAQLQEEKSSLESQVKAWMQVAKQTHT